MALAAFSFTRLLTIAFTSFSGSGLFTQKWRVVVEVLKGFSSFSNASSALRLTP